MTLTRDFLTKKIPQGLSDEQHVHEMQEEMKERGYELGQVSRDSKGDPLAYLELDFLLNNQSDTKITSTPLAYVILQENDQGVLDTIGASEGFF